MELNFIENENQDWVAEFEATGDFNLHLERDQKGTIIILQKQNEEDEYAFSSEFPNYYKIFNYDFAALLYPKYIKVISDSKVIKGSVNFNEGGGSGSGSNKKMFGLYPDYVVDVYPEFRDNMYFQYNEGMTWEQWLASDYNTMFDKKSDDQNIVYIKHNDTYMMIWNIDGNVNNSDVITNTIYKLTIDA